MESTLGKNIMSTLPILDFRNQIIDSLKRGKNLVVTAPTGSGKSTQIPQMLLDSGLLPGRILILQPRRLAARMLAARVAEERGVELGGEIGFQTRFETMVSEATRACFITEGILPRMLLSHRELPGVSAIIFDEFHERNLATDVGLAVTVDMAKTLRPDLRLIVMSATIDAAPIAEYVGGAEIVDCPGRTYPIDIRYTSAPRTASPWDLAADAVRSLIGRGAEGDILVFMPGAYEIRRSQQAIEQAVRGEPASIVALYGDMPAARQREVMEPLPRRKIIVATNIAETSLTIPGVRYVVDSGLARVNRYDAGRGFNTLFVEPISQASADQRAGRAGREAPGICIRLWSVSQHEGRAAASTPEIARVDLTETVLQLRTLGYSDVDKVPWFESPRLAALDAAHELLVLLGAITPAGELTDRGKDLCGFPMHPRLACLLLEAGKRGAAHLAAFTAALLSERSALSGKPDYPENAHQQETISDLFGQFCLLEKARESGFDPALCARNAINTSAAQAIFRTQNLFLQYCGRFGMRDRDDGDDAPVGLCRSLLAAYPDHLCVRKDQGTLFCSLRGNRRGELARESLVRKARLFVAAEIREIKTPKSELKILLSLAAEIKEQWLREDFAWAWNVQSRLEWNPVTKAVEGRMQTSCLGVVISESMNSDIDMAKASLLLAETIVSKGMEISTWDQGVEQWLKRVKWVAGLFPEQKLPVFSDDDRRLVVERLCESERHYERVRQKPLPLLQGMLTSHQREFIEEAAPTSLALPSGRKMKVSYEPGAPPRGRAKIQELFGLRETPKVAKGRASVLIEILAPNNRPVQITDDLGRFWTVHYPDIKKMLSRRYPKHEWR
jgi:ATP-dependent helicase HrpB